MCTGDLPMLTRGPFALFYGGTEIIPQLSKKSPGRHASLAILGFVIFQATILMYKKIVAKKVPNFGRLKGIVVENFLNVYRTIPIILIMTLLMGYIFLHHEAIKTNVKEENLDESVDNSWKKLLILATIETIIQLIPFISNPALRSYF